MEERREDAVLTKAMHDVAVPAGLHGQIAQRLRSVPPRRPVVRWAAAAACLLLVVATTFWALRPAPTAELDPNAIADFVDLQMNSNRDDIRAWYADMKYPIEPPPHFDYQFLTSYDIGLFAGKTKAPRLVFQTTFRGRPVVATVYVLPASQFRKREDVRAEARRSQSVKILDAPETSDYVYVAIYTGDSLDPLLLPIQ